MLAKIIATFFGTGYIKPSGTVGSLASAIVIFPILPRLHIIDAAIILVLVFIIGYFAIKSYTKKLEDKDPGEVVIDETLGMYVTIFAAIFINPHMDYRITVTVSFLVFRFFDIVKPLGINTIDQKIKGPFGTMLDDIVAGLYSAIFIYILSNVL